MPSLSYDAFVPWTNYHLTIGDNDQSKLFPSMLVEDVGRIHCADQGGESATARFATTGAMLMQHIRHVLGLMKDKRDGPRAITQPFAAGLTGRGWSFAPLIGAETSQLMCDGLAGCARLTPASLHPDCTAPAGTLALVAGGTRLRELTSWAEPFRLTVATSGTHLGPTIAGGIATASHGSRLGYGGLQNMVVGMHLITGPGEHVWIERADHPVLSDAAALELDSHASLSDKTIRVLRDDDLFEDVLVHLGGMGIVNCVAVQLVKDDPYDLLKIDRGVTIDWLRDLDAGQFRKIAAWLGRDTAPAFYEATVDPHDPFGSSALHTMYFPSVTEASPSHQKADLIRPGDAIVAFAARASSSSIKMLNPELFEMAPLVEQWSQGIGDPPPLHPPLRMSDPHTNATTIFEFYREKGKFTTTLAVEPSYRWSSLHGDEITGGMPGALYNASYAIPRNLLSTAIPLICDAVKRLPMSFVITIRFVSNPAGTMAFTRFEENAVIEIDGLSPLVSRLKAVELDPASADTPNLRTIFAQLADALPAGARAIRNVLDANNIPYSMHWAKLGDLDKAKVYRDFGNPDSDPESLIKRWRAARDQLLGEAGKAIFWNKALIDYGLLERPTAIPPLTAP